MPLPDERALVGREGVKRVSGLVQQRGHVLQHAGRIHENERSPSRVEGVAVTARGLARARVEVEQSFADHGGELAAELRQGEPPVVGIVRDGRLLLDARTLTDDEVDEVARAVLQARRRRAAAS